MNKMKKSAVISDCQKYRYELRRVWDDSKPLCMFIMLNPSTADADNDDPTIRRCINFANAWGYGGIIIGNLYAYRTKSPSELKRLNYPIGYSNTNYLFRMAKEASIIIAAWGANVKHKQTDLSKVLWDNVSKLHYLELTKDGIPKHPLYLKGGLTPIKF